MTPRVRQTFGKPSAPPARGAGSARIDWTAQRDAYVTGNISLAQVAETLSVSRRAVEKHACDRDANGGRTWAEWRAEFRAGVSGQATGILKRAKIAAAVSVAMQHATIVAALREQAAEAIRGVFEKLEPRDKVKLVLAIIAMERRVHGLDRVPVQVEVSGKDGGPIEHDVDASRDFDDATIAAAQRMLEAVFGPREVPT